MQGYFSLVLHAHLPFVRHPEHEKFLEESWLFEAITETYVPLLQMMEGWRRDGVTAPLTLTLSPTLCAMLLDPLLQDRYERHLHGLIELAEKEIHRTHWDRAFHELAWMYHHRFTTVRDAYLGYGYGSCSAIISSRATSSISARPAKTWPRWISRPAHPPG
jgi:1,4-alpha-glucan branching enzyme